MNIIVIQSTQILSKYFGQTEAQIRKIFALARQVTPCMLFFDDFDALAHKRYPFRIPFSYWLMVVI
jgi:peroxin-1